MAARPDLNRRFVRTLPWAAFEGATSVLSGLLTTFIIGRGLGVIDVGQAGLAVTIVGLVEIASSAGIQESVVRARSIHTGLTDTAFWAAMAFSLAGMAASCVLAMGVARAYGDPNVVALTATASLSLPFNALIAVPSATLTRKMRAALLARRLAASKLAALVALIGLAIAHTGPWSIVVSYVFGTLAAAVLILWTSARLPRAQFHVAELRSLLAFGGLFSLEAILWTVALRSFGLIFGYFHGLYDYGAFQFSLRLVDDLATLIQRTVLRFGLSYFSALTRASSTGPRAAFLNGTKLLTLLATPLFAGIALVAHDLVAVVFGAKWLVAVPMIQIVAVSWVFGFPRSLVAPVLRAEGKQAVLVRYAAVTSSYMLTAAFLTGHMSSIVAMIAFSARQLIAVPWGLMVIRRDIGVGIGAQLAAMRPGAIALLTMAVAVMLTQHAAEAEPAAVRLSLSALTGVVAYSSSQLAFDRDLRTMALAVRRRLTARQARTP